MLFMSSNDITLTGLTPHLMSNLSPEKRDSHSAGPTPLKGTSTTLFNEEYPDTRAPHAAHENGRVLHRHQTRAGRQEINTVRRYRRNKVERRHPARCSFNQTTAHAIHDIGKLDGD